MNFLPFLGTVFILRSRYRGSCYAGKFRVYFLFLITLSGCMLGPNYVRPKLIIPSNFKEAGADWMPAKPINAQENDRWWKTFKDPILDTLIEKVNVSNQDLIATEASWKYERALTKSVNPNSLLSSINFKANQAYVHQGPDKINDHQGGYLPDFSNKLSMNISSSLELDVWGRIRRLNAMHKANEELAAAKISEARLLNQMLLAKTYFQLRTADTLQPLYDEITSYLKKKLSIIKNRYEQGIINRSELTQACIDLKNIESDAAENRRVRAIYEHEIAVLIGTNPSTFSLSSVPLDIEIPDIPVAVPSTLLERRPDIVVAERSVQAANESIGVSQAALFPSFIFDAEIGFQKNIFTKLASLPTHFWSLGPLLTGVIFDSGIGQAKLEANRALYDKNVALYKQCVLRAFKQVEDLLISLREVEKQIENWKSIVDESNKDLQMIKNKYDAGTITSLDVLNAQNSLFDSRKKLILIKKNYMEESIDLIEALGGSWNIKSKS